MVNERFVLTGRILLSKAEGISRSVYVSMSMEVPKTLLRIWIRFSMTSFGKEKLTTYENIF